MAKWRQLAALVLEQGAVPSQHSLGGDQLCRSRSPVYQWLRGSDGFMLSSL